jgi:hypothetical protein
LELQREWSLSSKSISRSLSTKSSVPINLWMDLFRRCWKNFQRQLIFISLLVVHLMVATLQW